MFQDSAEDVRRKITNAYCPLKPENLVVKDAEEMTVLKDELKNPILDYIRYIIFGPPGAEALQIGDREFVSPDEIDAAWKGEEISEFDLKNAVVDRLNMMLEPVRKQFTENADSKAALELIEQHKATIKKEKDDGIEKPIPLRRLAKLLPSLERKPKSVAVLFAPQPRTGKSANQVLLVETVLDCLAGVEEAQKDSDLVVVFQEDWSSFVKGDFAEEKEPLKAIQAFYATLQEAMKLLRPELFEKVEFRMQSAEILRDPNNYWISAIDAGRRLNMGHCTAALNSGETLDESGQVVATLMHCADILAMSLSGGAEDGGVQKVTLIATAPEMSDANSKLKCARHSVSLKYLTEFLGEKVKAPTLRVGKTLENLCKKRSEMEEAARDMTGTEQNVLKTSLTLNGGENNWNTGIKKVFCKEGDVIRNDLLLILRQLESCCLLKKSDGSFGFFVAGNEKHNEPDRSFVSVDDVEKEFASGALFPSAFKPAAGKAIKEALLSLAKIASLPSECKLLEAFAKKAAKKK